ncbi:hypothetical protein D3C87_2010290 [compost metagenome]
MASGKASTSNMSGPLACWFSLVLPKSIEAASILTSTLPALAARSSVTTPLDLSNLPRQVDRPPMWSASKLG